MNVETYSLIGAIVFWIFVAGAGVALFSIAVILFDSWVLKPRMDKYIRLGQMEAAAGVQRNAYWFSEDPTTIWLLQKISADLLTGGAINVSQIRDEWRAKRIAQAETTREGESK